MPSIVWYERYAKSLFADCHENFIYKNRLELLLRAPIESLYSTSKHSNISTSLFHGDQTTSQSEISSIGDIETRKTFQTHVTNNSDALHSRPYRDFESEKELSSSSFSPSSNDSDKDSIINSDPDENLFMGPLGQFQSLSGDNIDKINDTALCNISNSNKISDLAEIDSPTTSSANTLEKHFLRNNPDNIIPDTNKPPASKEILSFLTNKTLHNVIPVTDNLKMTRSHNSIFEQSCFASDSLSQTLELEFDNSYIALVNHQIQNTFDNPQPEAETPAATPIQHTNHNLSKSFQSELDLLPYDFILDDTRPNHATSPNLMIETSRANLIKASELDNFRTPQLQPDMSQKAQCETTKYDHLETSLVEANAFDITNNEQKGSLNFSGCINDAKKNKIYSHPANFHSHTCDRVTPLTNMLESNAIDSSKESIESILKNLISARPLSTNLGLQVTNTESHTEVKKKQPLKSRKRSAESSQRRFEQFQKIKKRKEKTEQKLSEKINTKVGHKPKKKLYCHSFLKTGICKNGEQCTFSHDCIPQTKFTLCKFFKKGTCNKGAQCKFSHDFSTFHCRNLIVLGKCEASSCPYKHQFQAGLLSVEEKWNFVENNINYLAKLSSEYHNSNHNLKRDPFQQNQLPWYLLYYQQSAKSEAKSPMSLSTT